MKKKYLGVIAGLIAVSTGGFFILKMSNESAEGVIDPVKSASSDLVKEKEEALVNYEGKYITFNYPGSYHKLPTPKNTYIETVNLLGDVAGSSEISVNVSQETLAENSAARIRRLQTQTYTEEPLIHPLLKGVVFSKQPPDYEKAAIIEQNNKVVSVVVSNSSGKNLDKIFDILIKNLSWK